MLVFLVFFVMVVAVWYGWRNGGYKKFFKGETNSSPESLPPAVKQSQPMSQCHYCGLYFPSREAVVVGQAIYCSSAHATSVVKDH